jgi:hypothetical protein
MAAVVSPWQPLWAVVETGAPYRFVGLYTDGGYAMSRAMEFGTPTLVQPLCSRADLAALAAQLRQRREGA